MERVFYHLLVILLAFSYVMPSSNARPYTRAQKMPQETGDLPALGDTSKINMEEATSEVTGIRMDLEINVKDYPVPGPNGRHTPPGKS